MVKNDENIWKDFLFYLKWFIFSIIICIISVKLLLFFKIIKKEEKIENLAYLLNPSFEYIENNKFLNWEIESCSNPIKVILGAKEPFDGEKYLKIEGIKDNIKFVKIKCNKSIKVFENKIYNLSIRVKGEGKGLAGFRIDFTNQNISSYKFIKISSKWKKLIISKFKSLCDDFITINLITKGNFKNICFDNLILTGYEYKKVLPPHNKKINVKEYDKYIYEKLISKLRINNLYELIVNNNGNIKIKSLLNNLYLFNIDLFFTPYKDSEYNQYFFVSPLYSFYSDTYSSIEISTDNPIYFNNLSLFFKEIIRKVKDGIEISYNLLPLKDTHIPYYISLKFYKYLIDISTKNSILLINKENEIRRFYNINIINEKDIKEIIFKIDNKFYISLSFDKYVDVCFQYKNSNDSYFYIYPKNFNSLILTFSKKSKNFIKSLEKRLFFIEKISENYPLKAFREYEKIIRLWNDFKNSSREKLNLKENIKKKVVEIFKKYIKYSLDIKKFERDKNTIFPLLNFENLMKNYIKSLSSKDRKILQKMLKYEIENNLNKENPDKFYIKALKSALNLIKSQDK